MRKHRFALFCTIFVGSFMASAFLPGGLFASSAGQERTAWKSSALVESQTIPIPSDQQVIAQTSYQRATFFRGVVAEEEAALTYLAAVDRLNAQERLASQTRSGLTSPTSTTTSAPVTYGGSPGGAFACIRQHESGDNYAENTGNGYYGAYQFAPGTWNNAVSRAGYPQYANGRADLAPPAVQDAAAEWLQANDGWSQWSTAGMCGV